MGSEPKHLRPCATDHKHFKLDNSAQRTMISFVPALTEAKACRGGKCGSILSHCVSKDPVEAVRNLMRRIIACSDCTFQTLYDVTLLETGRQAETISMLLRWETLLVSS